MASMTADAIVRTGRAVDKFRQLVVVQGEGKTAVRRVLSTPITKVEWNPQFRFGGSPRLVEQYCFRVDGKTVERFADAAALVMKKHHVTMGNVEESSLQTYVQRALRIMRGEEALRIHTELTPEEPTCGSSDEPQA